MLFFTFFFFNDTATTEIYTLSLHDALPISKSRPTPASPQVRTGVMGVRRFATAKGAATANPTIPPTKAPLRSSGASHRSLRSEEHTSELQSQSNLVCRLLLEKKKTHTQDYRIAVRFADAVTKTRVDDLLFIGPRTLVGLQLGWDVT